jgi:hypothetical protein
MINGSRYEFHIQKTWNTKKLAIPESCKLRRMMKNEYHNGILASSVGVDGGVCCSATL